MGPKNLHFKAFKGDSVRRWLLGTNMAKIAFLNLIFAHLFLNRGSGF